MLNLNTLNDAQREAVMHGEGPLLVLAGPGSGKTFTITQRILYLIEVMQVDPSEILVITFTKEAALSMQRRFLEQSGQTYPVNFGTFHSVFYQILRNTNPSRTRLIWGESQKKNLVISILKKLFNKKEAPSVQSGALIRRTADNRNAAYDKSRNYAEEAATVLRAVSFYKNTSDLDKTLHKLPSELKEHFPTILRSYEEKRMAQGALDFDDMVYECAELLEKNAEARRYWSHRFSYILMDEFQDINPMQYRVINLLTKVPYNLFAVGDDDQAIYGFRGSKPACMKQFEEDYHAKKILLNINYRSYPEIVKSSLKVIETNKERFSKKLLPCKAKQREAAGESINQFVNINAFREKEEEYAYLLQKLKNDLDNGEETGGHIAVLFRTNMYMQGLAARLNRQGIPYEMKEKVGNLYDHFIIKDIMAYLRLAYDEGNRELLLQILNKPNRFISREALYCPEDFGSGNKLRQSSPKDVTAVGLLQRMKRYYSKEIVGGTWEFQRNNRALEGISLLEKQLAYIKGVSLYLAVQYICKVVGYERYLREKSCIQRNGFGHAGNELPEEWQDILDFVKGEAREYDSLQEWMLAQKQYAEQLKQGAVQRKNHKDGGNMAETSAMRHNARIHLMTVHASKGLEFDKVYIPDCNERVFPHGSMPDKESCEEECRIFYVAMTRAKKNLELLYLAGTKERPRVISRFLNPLLKRTRLQ